MTLVKAVIEILDRRLDGQPEPEAHIVYAGAPVVAGEAVAVERSLPVEPYGETSVLRAVAWSGTGDAAAVYLAAEATGHVVER